MVAALLVDMLRMLSFKGRLPPQVERAGPSMREIPFPWARAVKRPCPATHCYTSAHLPLSMLHRLALARLQQSRRLQAQCFCLRLESTTSGSWFPPVYKSINHGPLLLKTHNCWGKHRLSI
eukprot:565802-Amphidinium_carterae.2